MTNENLKCYYTIINGLTSYETGIEIQSRAKDLVMSGHADCILILLQHSPVFSVGKAGGAENILMSESFLKEMGIEVHKSDRGGNVTYHGPGQIVGYPIMNLKKFKPDVHWYFDKLEQVLIDTLKDNGLVGERKVKYPGAWVGDKKIAAIGVHISKWITTHGFSINISVNKEHFKYINPCGILEFGITSLDEICNIEFDQVELQLKDNFARIFGIELVRRNLEDFTD